MLAELRKVIPAFLTRVDQPDRGGAWSEYLAANRAAMEEIAGGCSPPSTPSRATRSRSPTSIPTREIRIVAAALYAVSTCPTTS
jgi:hypothetical protein